MKSIEKQWKEIKRNEKHCRLITSGADSARCAALHHDFYPIIVISNHGNTMISNLIKTIFSSYLLSRYLFLASVDFELGLKSKCGLKRGKKCQRIFESKRVEMAGELKLKRVERPLSVQRQRSHHSYKRATLYQLSYKWSSPIGHIVLRCWTLAHLFLLLALL